MGEAAKGHLSGAIHSLYIYSVMMMLPCVLFSFPAHYSLFLRIILFFHALFTFSLGIITLARQPSLSMFYRRVIHSCSVDVACVPLVLLCTFIDPSNPSPSLTP